MEPVQVESLDLNRTTTMDISRDRGASVVNEAKGLNAAHKSEQKEKIRREYSKPSLKNDFTWKLKIMLGFLQIITNLAVSVQIPLPETFMSFVRYLTVINFDFVQASSAGCVVPTPFFHRLAISVVVPILFVFVVFVVYLLPKLLCPAFFESSEERLKREKQLSDARIDENTRAELQTTHDQKSRERSWVRFWRIILFLMFLIYPTVSASVLGVFVCKNAGGTSYLLADMSEACFTSAWNQYAIFAGVFILVYPLGIPLFFFKKMWSHREELDRPAVRAELGFLYDGYHSNAWWFEMVDMLHKLLLTSVLAFLPTSVQLPLGMVVCILFMAVILCTKPYKRKGDDHLHLMVQVEIFLLMYCAYAFQTYGYERNADRRRVYDYAMSIILIFIVLYLFGLFSIQGLKYLAACFRDRYKEYRRKKLAEQEGDEAVLLERKDSKSSINSFLNEDLPEPEYMEPPPEEAKNQRANEEQEYKMQSNPLASFHGSTALQVQDRPIAQSRGAEFNVNPLFSAAQHKLKEQQAKEPAAPAVQDEKKTFGDGMGVGFGMSAIDEEEAQKPVFRQQFGPQQMHRG
eukprot:TRINITY_DN379_c0_g1_i2.p1 TRINITY_DN379_c0_g1~~TRINITY_DN379_c0_g1_i2.p1  ORF type:complete len:631 (+),score=258.67 TRINITY_DN379_c0_g1_i2:174-1895(+)